MVSVLIIANHYSDYIVSKLTTEQQRRRALDESQGRTGIMVNYRLLLANQLILQISAAISSISPLNALFNTAGSLFCNQRRLFSVKKLGHFFDSLSQTPRACRVECFRFDKIAI
jgi:hypothetical protein